MALPDTIRLKNRCLIPGMEALCVVLYRLSYPSRLTDLMEAFARSESVVSRIVSHMINFIFNRYSQLLRTLQHPSTNLNEMAELVGNVSPLKNCIGFIDGTVRAICRPVYDHETMYNGHKRKHAVKFQSVMVPIGISVAVHGPYEGKCHDSFLLAQSGLMGQMAALPRMDNGDQFCLYGDAAYPSLPQMITAYQSPNPMEEQFNKSMSKARESVEYGFGKVVMYWPFCDFKKNLKLHLQPVGKIYLVCTLLTNCHTCLYGNNVNSLFDSSPPSLEDYLAV